MRDLEPGKASQGLIALPERFQPGPLSTESCSESAAPASGWLTRRTLWSGPSVLDHKTHSL